MKFYRDMPEFKTEYQDDITGDIVRDILVNRYPGMEIYILMGYEISSQEFCPHNVFFNFKDAVQMKKNVERGSTSDFISESLYLTWTTPIYLDDRITMDLDTIDTEHHISDMQFEIIYDHLRGLLRDEITEERHDLS
jgi:hypothetical protein